jgi:hypothetical protein
MSRVATALRMGLGGAVFGGFLGIFAGGLLGALLGGLVGDVSVGLDGGLFAGCAGFLGGGLFGVFLAAREDAKAVSGRPVTTHGRSARHSWGKAPAAIDE